MNFPLYPTFIWQSSHWKFHWSSCNKFPVIKHSNFHSNGPKKTSETSFCSVSYQSGELNSHKGKETFCPCLITYWTERNNLICTFLWMKYNHSTFYKMLWEGLREKYCMQLILQKELGGKMHFSVAKGIKPQSWKDSGFECKVKEESIPKI